ncbi:hypothetical protein U9M48_000742 [Paspalum notatum var. saurae]|uniref:Transposase n=1 Tax=Paspalum notatum var. saurae TaxID=547442 RepID=A0AAQ3PE81_PASNO
MAPGRKSGKTKKPAEAPLTDYEKMRAQLMMRNNRKLQSLGVTALASIMNNNAQNSKPSASKDLDPLYNPRDDDEYMAEDIPDKESDDTATRMNVSTAGAATRLTKRVLAPQEQDQIARITRRRTRELSATNEEGGNGTTTNEQEGFIEAALVSANCPTQLEDENQMDETIERRRVGRGLDRMSRGLNVKIPVHIEVGNRRPEAPIQAAKLATEGGIILRQHVPILPHWKEYKKDKDIFEVYMSKVCAPFTIDKKSSAVRDACMDLMKRGQRQMRHKLKKQYFDDIPANQVRITSPIDTMTDEQWIKLVETWSTPRHKKQAKYKDEPPTAIDLFKECHYSNKNGFTEPVKKAIVDMEAIVAEAVEDGQVPKTPDEAVFQVLPKTKFLSNVGLQSVAPKRNAKSAARVQELELELQAEKQGALDLRGTLDEQQVELHALKLLVAHSEDAMKQQKDQSEEKMKEQADEIASLKKGQEETNALLRRLLSLSTQAQSRV